jgi:AcrR family transcriptional regulator
MDAVAQSIGVSKPTIYEYFENKRALCEAVIASAVRDMDVSLIVSAARREISFEEYMNRVPAACLDMVASKSQFALLLLFIREAAGRSEVADQLRALVEGGMFRTFEDMISAAMQRGECRSMDPATVRRLFMGPLNTVALQVAYTERESIDLEVTRSYFDHYFLMLKNYLLIVSHQVQQAA